MLNNILIGSVVFVVVVVLVLVIRSLLAKSKVVEVEVRNYDQYIKIVGYGTHSTRHSARADIKLYQGQVISMLLDNLSFENCTVSFKGFTVAVVDLGKGITTFNPEIMIDFDYEMKFYAEYYNYPDNTSVTSNSEIQVHK